MKTNEHTAREHHWMCMTSEHYYFVVPREKIKILEKRREKYTGRRSPEDVKYYKNRDKRILDLLVAGMDRGEAFKKMKKSGHLTYKGFTITLGRFRTICCLINKRLKTPKAELKQDAAYRLHLDGLTVDEIATELKMKRYNVDNALARARYSAKIQTTN